LKMRAMREQKTMCSENVTESRSLE
jgi:hypothetical protein